MKRRAWALAGGGCATLFLALLAGGMLWWQYVSFVPPVPQPQVTLPVPNGRDDFLAAVLLIPASNRNAMAEAYKYERQGELVRLKAPTPALRKMTDEATPALARLRVGLGREYGLPPIVSMSQKFPELAPYRELGRMLTIESELALREGRPADALRSGLDGVKFGSQVPRGSPLIHGLVGIAIGTMALRSLENAEPFADAEACAQAARELWKLDAEAPTFGETLANERTGGLVAITAICRMSDPRIAMQNLGTGGGGTPTAADLGTALQFFVTPKRQIVSNYQRYMDASIARVNKPYHAWGAPTAKPTDPISSILLPMYESSGFSWARQQALRRLLITRLAVRAYTLREGHPPASLAALTPKYLPAVPQDPFAPAPPVYRVVNGKPLIYSRGADGDDDGGKDLGTRMEMLSNGDLASTRPPAQVAP